MFFDAHFHYAVCVERGVFDIQNLTNGAQSDLNFSLDNTFSNFNWVALSCAHSPNEWKIQSTAPKCVFKSFGIHPQIVGNVNIQLYKDFLYGLAEDGKLDAIGEAGFDFFSDDFKATKDLQEDVWNFELELASRYCLPIVIHCRKGNEMLFRDAGLLKKIPVVLFHSFMGSFVEASSLIKRGINCFFSFGKQVMNNNKKVIDCVKKLPIDYLLMETDSPFQTLKGEENTFPSDIIKIYQKSYNLRYGKEYGISDYNVDYEYNNFCEKLSSNGKKLLFK